MKIQKTELAQKINKLKSIATKKTTVPALQGILVKNGYLIANNMEILVKAKVEAIGDESFIIPEKAFDLIANLPDGEIDITVEDGSITIKTGKIKNKYQTISPELFPVNESIDDDNNKYSIDSQLLLRSMKRVLYAVPSQIGGSIMTSLCLNADEGYLNFTGLDGHVCAWDRIDYDGKFTMLIPKATAEKILSLGITGDVSIQHSRNKSSAIFVTDEYEVHTRLVEGNYFEYRRLFGGLPIHTRIDRKDLLNAMTRAKMCVEENVPVRFNMSGDLLNISIKSYSTDYTETLSLQDPVGEDVLIGFNPKLVIETLKAFENETISLQFANSKQPMIVEADDSNFKAFVLPVAIKQ